MTNPRVTLTSVVLDADGVAVLVRPRGGLNDIHAEIVLGYEFPGPGQQFAFSSFHLDSMIELLKQVKYHLHMCNREPAGGYRLNVIRTDYVENGEEDGQQSND